VPLFLSTDLNTLTHSLVINPPMLFTLHLENQSTQSTFLYDRNRASSTSCGRIILKSILGLEGVDLDAKKSILL
jgi:hypothetical protein